MRIGITGGTGFIGSHLVEHLISKGHTIECLALPHDMPGWLKRHSSLSFTEGNLLAPESLTDFVKRSEIIIHLAGLTRCRKEEDFMSFNFKGTKHLMESVKEFNPGIKQLIIMSSQAAVGPSSNGIFLTEDAPLKPISPYGKSKAVVEKFLHSTCSHFPITIIRAPSVYGPRDRDFIELVRLIKKRIKPIIGKKTRLSFVYVKNLIHGISAAINNPKAIGETFFITDEGAYSWMEFGKFIEKSVCKKALPIYIPQIIVKTASGISRFYAFITKKPILLTKHKLEEMNNPYWLISNSKALKLLGYKPAISTERGINETVKWYEENGWC